MKPIKSLPFFTAIALVAAPLTVQADGVYKMFDHNENYIDELEIVGDVIGPDGYQHALFEMRAMNMQFYIPPDVAYVEVSETNPIIANRVVFQGYWVSTARPGQERWASCARGTFTDHEGFERAVYGDLEYRYTGLDDDGLSFDLKLGFCGDEVEDWAFHTPASFLPPLADAQETCGNDPNTVTRALGCSDVISHPQATDADVSHAFWSRAYVRCGNVPVQDTISDLTAAVRIYPSDWHDYYSRVSGYTGPDDGQLTYQLHGAISRFAYSGCR